MDGALIGFGVIGMGHAVAYEKVADMTIKAIVDPVPSRRELAKKMFSNINVYATFADMMNNESISFIDICSPPSTHFEYIKNGLKYNCNVIGEKPFLLKTDEYLQVYDLMKLSGKVIYPSHNYKFAPILQKLKKTVAAESFGNIVTGNFRTLRTGHALGIQAWQPNWRRDYNISGGGIVRDHGPHSIYMACSIVDKLPVAVSCIMGNFKKDQFSATEDTAFLTLYFNDNVKFTIDLSWVSDIRNSYYCVIGERETIIVEDDLILHMSTIKGAFKEKIPSEFNDPSHRSWFVSMFSDFLDTVRFPEKKQIPLILEAFMTTLIIEKAYISVQQNGKRIEIVSEIEDFNKKLRRYE